MTASDPEKAWKIAENTRACFFSVSGHQMPMSAIVRKDEGAIYFLTDANSEKVGEIKDDHTVQLTFSDHSANDYLVVEGQAQVSNDREKIRELWSTFAQAWWDSPEDPNIRLISVSPTRAEFWDGPGSITASAKMLFAAVTGGRPDMGENKQTGM
jgi:general stress protein 26